MLSNIETVMFINWSTDILCLFLLIFSVGGNKIMKPDLLVMILSCPISYSVM